MNMSLIHLDFSGFIVNFTIIVNNMKKKNLPKAAQAAILLIAPICPKEHPWKYEALKALAKCTDKTRLNAPEIPTKLSEAVWTFVWSYAEEVYDWWNIREALYHDKL
jgi:hypothetical protein